MDHGATSPVAWSNLMLVREWRPPGLQAKQFIARRECPQRRHHAMHRHLVAWVPAEEAIERIVNQDLCTMHA